MPTDLPPQYNPQSVEKAIYDKWLAAKSFHAVPDARANKFSMVIPPPNVTGALHLGHAINGTIQDILARYHRMLGDNTLWMPGIDHAGIATQVVVEKTIFEKEKKSRHDLATATHTSREELVRRIWEWKEQFGARILTQLQSIGSSCDWDRTRFTLDEQCARAVREAFFKMFKDGLIFRGKRLVNWDTHLQTAVADDEIYHEPVKGQLTSIKYPVADDAPTESSVLSPQSYLIVATTRPETMLGDTAVAVHPDDPRYKHLIGKHVILPLVGRKIPIIADGLLVDPKFGTGVVKVTPGHDPNDYATGQRHHLDSINLLTPDGKVNENGTGEFLGKKYSYTGLKFATAARKQVLADLEALGLIAEQKPHDHEVGHSDRSKTPIEPYLSDQWFVRMGDIADVSTSETRPLGSVFPAESATTQSDTLTSETRPSGSVPPPPHSTALAYFISFHTYATWLHGEDKGSVDPTHNTPGADFIPPDSRLLERDAANMSSPPFELSIQQRQSVLRTIQEVAAHRGWTLHAVNIRSNHVHAVVAGNHAPERMMNDFKSWATRRMKEAGLITDETKVWSRHGSTPYLWKQKNVAETIDYVLHKQGPNQPGTFLPDAANQTLPDGRVSEVPARSQQSSENREISETRPLGSVVGGGITLANGTRVPGLAQAAIDAVTSGRVKITPDRYAKGYIDWLSQKRDWCISRQLWWGHRIPIWTRPEDADPVKVLELLKTLKERRGVHIAVRDFPTGKTALGPNGEPLDGFELYVCLSPEADDVEKVLDSWGFVRDPDVLDTWFSSALWPLSTMGWPATGTSSAPEDQLLPYFYPTSTLSTARDILTLWVARMVIFGLYCHGEVPFKNVYIHPVIQDGEGKIMSKSKGNGVDPVEIVASHGADALRFTLASLATETQDIRMPVVKDPKTGTNTSPKFDLGRNFANKIWNASRYILGAIDDTTSYSPPFTGDNLSHLEDRWILSRLSSVTEQVAAAIQNFRFSELAQSLYHFFWTDLCDWYLEIAKSRIKSGDVTVQSILFHCLETSLKLLHPLMPFITEEIWNKLPDRQTMLITASWPLHDKSHIDSDADQQIGLLQELITQIRDIQNRYPAAKGKPAIFKPHDSIMQESIERSRQMIESLANIHIVENNQVAQKPDNAATGGIPGRIEIFIAGVIEKGAETAKLQKRQAELENLVLSTRNKLGNEAFVTKAPAKIIQGLRDQLAKYTEELAAIEKNLAELQ